MAAFINFNVKEDSMKALLDLAENGFVKLTVQVSDEPNQYGKNAYITNGKKGDEKVYFGSGKVTWTNGTISAAPAAEKPAEKPATAAENVQQFTETITGDLPF